MAVLSEQPYSLTSILEWYGVNINLKNFTSIDYYDWCKQHDMCYATDYRRDEAEDLMICALRNQLSEVFATGPFDNQWYTEFHRVFVMALAKCWELDAGSIWVDIKQRYCRSLNMTGYGCAPVKITIIGHMLPGSKVPEEKACVLEFHPKFDHIDDWARLIVKDGNGHGFIIAGPQQ